jgi:hypothetical protein
MRLFGNCGWGVTISAFFLVISFPMPTARQNKATSSCPFYQQNGQPHASVENNDFLFCPEILHPPNSNIFPKIRVQNYDILNTVS